MNRIKEVLEEKGIKQTWLAENLDKSYNMVNGYVQNRQQPRLEVLSEIAKILDVDIKELLTSSKNITQALLTHARTSTIKQSTHAPCDLKASNSANSSENIQPKQNFSLRNNHFTSVTKIRQERNPKHANRHQYLNKLQVLKQD